MNVFNMPKLTDAQFFGLEDLVKNGRLPVYMFSCSLLGALIIRGFLTANKELTHVKLSEKGRDAFVLEQSKRSNKR